MVTYLQMTVKLFPSRQGESEVKGTQLPSGQVWKHVPRLLGTRAQATENVTGVRAVAAPPGTEGGAAGLRVAEPEAALWHPAWRLRAGTSRVI